MLMIYFTSYCRSLTNVMIYMCQGDTKGSARGGEGSAKKDPIGSQLSSQQVCFQSSFKFSITFISLLAYLIK